MIKLIVLCENLLDFSGVSFPAEKKVNNIELIWITQGNQVSEQQCQLQRWKCHQCSCCFRESFSTFLAKDFSPCAFCSKGNQVFGWNTGQNTSFNTGSMLSKPILLQTCDCKCICFSLRWFCVCMAFCWQFRYGDSWCRLRMAETNNWIHGQWSADFST